MSARNAQRLTVDSRNDIGGDMLQAREYMSAKAKGVHSYVLLDLRRAMSPRAWRLMKLAEELGGAVLALEVERIPCAHTPLAPRGANAGGGIGKTKAK